MGIAECVESSIQEALFESVCSYDTNRESNQANSIQPENALQMIQTTYISLDENKGFFKGKSVEQLATFRRGSICIARDYNESDLNPVKEVLETVSSLEKSLKQEEALLEHIEQKLVKLDVNSPSFKEDLESLKQAVVQLQKVTGKDLQQLEKVLNLLSDPTSFKIDPTELQFVEALERKYGHTKGKISDPLARKFVENEKMWSKEEQKHLIKELQKGGSDLLKLEKRLEKDLPLIHIAAKKDRLGWFIDDLGLSSQKPEYKKDLCLIYFAFKTFTDELSASYNCTQSKGTEDLNKRQEAHHIIIQLLQDDFVNYVNNISGKADINIMSVLSDCSHIKNSKKSLINTFLSLQIEKECWLLENAGRHKRAYNQANEIENLGGGVCFANSLYRASQIEANPMISFNGIQMGSTPSTRVSQSILIHNEDQMEKRNIVYQTREIERKKVEKKAIRKNGLEEVYQQTFFPASPKDLNLFLKNEIINRILDEDQRNITHAVLEIRPKDSGGHAINIQFDLQHNQFRIFDDNVGVIEYEDYKSFLSGLEGFLKTFYSNNNYLINFRSLKNSKSSLNLS